MSRTLLSSTIRLAYEREDLRPQLLPIIITATRGERLDSGVRRKINADLVRRGMDGNGRFRKIGEALGVISEVIGKHGLEPDTVFSADYFRRDDGQQSFDLAFSNPSDPFSPVPVSNSMLVIQWHKFVDTTGNYEIVAYLS